MTTDDYQRLDLKRSIDRIWLFKSIATFIHRWSCFFILRGFLCNNFIPLISDDLFLFWILYNCFKMTFETFTYTTKSNFFLMSSFWLLKLLIITPLAVNWKKPLQLTCQSKLDSFFSRTVIPYLQCDCMISDLNRCLPSLPLNDRGCFVGEGVFFFSIYWSLA